ncbi:PH domain-containing protein [Microbispora sp. RL4-1S]|uniref:PH domain-containing protein n=1 Tax=Microbispora oryzae TaxID=2806554 RepID=A0A940WLA3_9ACTN|nr:PH domain-containing protein [Microbispora oryzae]
MRDPALRVSRRAVVLWLIEAITGFVLLVGAAAGVALWVDGADWPGAAGWLSHHAWTLPAAVGAVLLPFVVVEPPLRYAVHRWELSGDVLYARSGWLSREWVFVPVSRIQTVDTAQGWYERVLRLATLRVRTASHAGSSTIIGLDDHVAGRLAEELARRAEQLRDDAT